jgi:hypothetical protein
VHERSTSHFPTPEDLNELFRRCEEQRAWSRGVCAETKKLRLISATARMNRADGLPQGLQPA